MNKNLEVCIESALNVSYLEGFRDAKAGKESRVSFQVATTIVAEANVKKDEWSGRWLTFGGMFMEIEIRDGKYFGSCYDETGVCVARMIQYTDKGTTDLGKPWHLKQKLSGLSTTEPAWPVK